MTRNEQQRRPHPQPGFTLVELLLFIGIIAIMGSTVVAVFISTQDARIRQQGIAALEQRSGQLMQILTRRVRRAERILYPVSGQQGSVLALQMASEGEFPTLFGQSGSTLVIVEKDTKSVILPLQVQIANLMFKNIGDTNVLLSFDLSTVILLPRPSTYSRHFEGSVTIFPVDQSLAGGCAGSCPSVTCAGSVLRWNVCTVGVCSQSPNSLQC